MANMGLSTEPGVMPGLPALKEGKKAGKQKQRVETVTTDWVLRKHLGGFLFNIRILTA